MAGRAARKVRINDAKFPEVLYKHLAAFSVPLPEVFKPSIPTELSLTVSVCVPPD